MTNFCSAETNQILSPRDQEMLDKGELSASKLAGSRTKPGSRISMIAMKKFVHKAFAEKKITETNAEIDGALHNSGYWSNLEKSHDSEDAKTIANQTGA